MSRTLKLLFFLLAVPLLAIFVAQYTLNDMEKEWRLAVAEAMGTEAAQEAPAFQTLCSEEPEFRQDFDEACDLASTMTWLRLGGIIAIILGLGMVAAIAYAGRRAQNKRELLWRLFGPGLRVTLFAMVLLIALHGVLGVAAIWYGESALMGQVHIKLVAGIGIVALIGIFTMAKATLRFVKPGSTSALGLVVPRNEHPQLWQFVDDLAARLSTKPPENIVVGLEPNFYVTEFDLHHPQGMLTGRTLFLSLPLCRILSKEELSAIIAHELGHFRGEDTAFSQRFYPIFRGAEEALAGLHRNTAGFYSAALMPAVYTLAFFLESFVTAESKISREREFVADQAGAMAAGGNAMAAALVKVHAYADLWNPLIEQVEEKLRDGAPIANASLHFRELAEQKAVPESLEGLDEQTMPHPVDSHPPLRQRLDALGISLSQVSEYALQVTLAEPAAALFTGPESVEAALSDQLNSLVRRASAQEEAA